MTCKDFIRSLEERHDRNLTEPERSDMDRHSQECASCRNQLAVMEKLGSFIADSKNATPNPFISTRILQRLEAEFAFPDAPKKSPWPLFLKPVALTLALAAGLLIGTLTTRPSSETAQVENQDAAQFDELKKDLFIQEFVDEDKKISLIH